jgi:hypothetical protein
MVWKSSEKTGLLRDDSSQPVNFEYLGYWIPGSPSMDYKAQYRPHELLLGYPADTEEPHWIPLKTGKPDGRG